MGDICDMFSTQAEMTDLPLPFEVQEQSQPPTRLRVQHIQTDNPIEQCKNARVLFADGSYGKRLVNVFPGFETSVRVDMPVLANVTPRRMVKNSGCIIHKGSQVALWLLPFSPKDDDVWSLGESMLSGTALDANSFVCVEHMDKKEIICLKYSNYLESFGTDYTGSFQFQRRPYMITAVGFMRGTAQPCGSRPKFTTKWKRVYRVQIANSPNVVWMEPKLFDLDFLVDNGLIDRDFLDDTFYLSTIPRNQRAGISITPRKRASQTDLDEVLPRSSRRTLENDTTLKLVDQNLADVGSDLVETC